MKMQMHYFTLIATAIGFTLAQRPVRPRGLYSLPQCCSTNALGVLSLDYKSRKPRT